MKMFILVFTLVSSLSAFANCDLQAHDLATEKIKQDYGDLNVGSLILESLDEASQYTYFIGLANFDSSFKTYVKLQLTLDCSLKNAVYVEKSELPWPWNEN
jgi:hypothetical protein